MGKFLIHLFTVLGDHIMFTALRARSRPHGECAFVCLGRSVWLGRAGHTDENTHTYGYAYGTESGATRRPRVPIPKSTSKEPAKPGGLQTEKWPKRKETNDDRESNRLTAVRAHLQKANQSPMQHHVLRFWA